MKMKLPFEKTEINETMEDYIRWRGDLSFDTCPLNIIDSMIFCEISYVDFTQAVPEDGRAISLARCGEKIKEKNCYSLRNLYGGHEDFFDAVCASKRFGSVLLKNYEDIFEEKDQVQFSACEFVLKPKLSYVAFRGTDNSLVGWKEDFMIAFTRIKAQELARDYLQKVMRPRHQYYVGGHSKGGNLVKYACAWCSEKQLNSILRIYDFDGPGFCPEVFDRSRLDKLKNKVTRVIPEFCVIGKIFEVPFPDQYIVKSNETGTNQHDIISWRIKGLTLDMIAENDKTSEWLDQTIAQWVDGASQEERQTFVNELFASLAAGNASTMQEVYGKGLPEVVKAMAAASPTSKKLVASLAESALHTANKKTK
jgi:hypothetical protein